MSKFIVGWDDLAEAPKNEVSTTEELTKIWNFIQKKCKPFSADQSSQTTTSQNSQLSIPSLKKNFQNTRDKKDLVIVYSQQTGVHVAKLLVDKLSARGLSVILAQNANDAFNADETEARVANSTGMVVLLTANCLKQIEVVFAMEAAKHYYRHPSLVILAHDAGSCFFPGYDEQPESLQLFFSEKAVTLLQCYIDLGVKQIHEKFDEEKLALNNILSNQQEAASTAFSKFISAYEGSQSLTIDQVTAALGEVVPGEQLQDLIVSADKNGDGRIDMGEFCSLILNSPKLAGKLADKKDDHDGAPGEDITTRLFLSHKRSTGQAIAGRLFEGLKDDYKIFLDSEAKFKIHNLQQIVQNTSVLVFILSGGIFQSRWCLEELKSAVHDKKQVIVVRDLGFQMPDEIPPEWKEVEHVIRTKDELIWMAEYNQACLDALKIKIGPSDQMLKMVDQTLLYRPEFLRILKEEKCLAIDRSSAIGGVYPLWWKFHDQYEITRIESLTTDLTGLEDRVDWTGIKEAHLKLHYSYLEPIVKVAGNCLTKISLYNSYGNAGQLGCIGTLPNLKYLNLSYTDASAEDMQQIFKLKKLEELHLADSEVSDEILEKFEKGFPELRVLDISWCRRCDVSDKGVTSVAKGCPNLRKLFLARLRISDASFKAIGENCHQLEELALTEFEVEGEGLAPIGKGCPNLKTLAISDFENNPLPTISDLSEGCTKLNILKINNCHSLGLTKPAKFPSLTEMHIANCEQFTEEDFVHLFSYLPKVFTVETGTAPNLSDAGLKALASEAKELKSLYTAPAEKVTDEGLKAIAENCKSLVYLSLSHAPKITLAGVIPFTEINDKISLSVYSQGIPHEEMQKVNKALSDKRRKAEEEAAAKLASMSEEELKKLWEQAFAQQAAQNQN